MEVVDENRETVDWKVASIGIHLSGFRLFVQVTDSIETFGLQAQL